MPRKTEDILCLDPMGSIPPIVSKHFNWAIPSHPNPFPTVSIEVGLDPLALMLIVHTNDWGSRHLGKEKHSMLTSKLN